MIGGIPGPKSAPRGPRGAAALGLRPSMAGVRRPGGLRPPAAAPPRRYRCKPRLGIHRIKARSRASASLACPETCKYPTSAKRWRLSSSWALE